MQNQSLVRDNLKSDEETITPSFYRSGPSKLRSCTDILCLFLFIVILISAAATLGLAVWNGNPYLLFNGFDSQGRMCGKDNLKDYPFVYFLDPFVKDFAWKTVCVSRCPNVEDMTLNCKNVEKIEGVSECPPISHYSTEKSLNSFCNPEDEELAQNLDAALKTMESEGFLAETFRSWKIIAMSMLMAYLISFIFITGTILLSRVIVIFSIIIIQLCLLFTACAMLFSYTNQKEFFQILKSDFASGNNKSLDAIRTASANERLITSISFFIASFVFLIYTIFWRNHIKLLMDGVKATSKFIGSNKSFIGFSFLIFLIYSLYIIGWIIIALYLCTWSSKSPQDFPKETLPFDRYEIDHWAKLLLTIHIVTFVWIILFILSTYNFLVSSSCMQWYFAQGPTENLRASNPLTISLQFYFKYHLGSVALGSILHLLFRPFNFICAPIYKEALMKTEDDTNCCVKYILKCCRCFFILYEEYFMYICREAFLEIALQGKHFFAASKDAYFLIHRNSKIYQATDILGSLAYWIGNLFITFVTTFCCVGLALKVEFFAVDIEKPLNILGIILVLAFFVSSLSIIFLGYSMDALIFTYLIDQEIEKYYDKKSDGTEARNAPAEVKEFIRIVDEIYI